MKEMNISDELFSRFLEGKTDELEEARLLQAMEAEDLSLEDLAAIGVAAQLADNPPRKKPDMAKAEEQIRDTLNRDIQKSSDLFVQKRKARMRVVWAMAASLAIVLAVALFVLFRPDSTEQKFVQNNTDSSAVTTTQPKTDKNLAQSNTSLKNSSETPKYTEGGDKDMTAPEVNYNSQVLEKQYAHTQTANLLKVLKPGKNDYRVLCKNLEKSLNFEWETENIQSLRLMVKNTQGKLIAETNDPSAKHFSLTYKTVYPEKQLDWHLQVTFRDGKQETRSGQVKIDYQVQ